MKNNRKQRGAYNEVSFRMVFLLVFLMTTVTGFAQNKTVSGIVVDKAGEAVIGASVLVKGTSNGTITDLMESLLSLMFPKRDYYYNLYWI